MDVGLNSSTSKLELFGDGFSADPVSFRFTLSRGTTPGQGVVEAAVRSIEIEDRGFALPSLPESADQFGLDAQTSDALDPGTLLRRTLDIAFEAAGSAVTIAGLVVTHVEMDQVSRPVGSSLARISVMDRRILWREFGGVTVEANHTIKKTASGGGDEDQTYLDRTLNGTAAWTVAELLSLCLTELGEDNGEWTAADAVGRPSTFVRGGRITYPEKMLAGDFPKPTDVTWEGAESAVGRLDELLSRYKLELIFSVRGEIEIVFAGIGDLPDVARDLVIGNEISYQNERVNRPTVYVVIGDRISISRRVDDLVPVVYAPDGTVGKLSDQASALGVTAAQILKGSMAGGTVLFGGAWSFVKDSSGDTEFAGGDIAEIQRRRALLASALKLWRIPNTAAGEANADFVPVSKELPPVSVATAIFRPENPKIFGARPVRKGFFSIAAGTWEIADAASEYTGPVRVVDPELGIFGVGDVLGAASVDGPANAPRLTAEIASTLDEDNSNVSARFSHLKRDRSETFSSLDLAQAAEMRVGGDAGIVAGHPLLDYTFVSRLDDKGADFYPGLPTRIKYIHVPGFQLILKLDDSGGLELSNTRAVQRLGDSIIDDAISRNLIQQSLKRVYGVPLDLSPNGLVDTVAWNVSEPGGDGGAITEITANDLTQSAAPPKPRKTLGGARSIEEWQFVSLRRRVFGDSA